jgi:benzoyl-CoA reductase/2-hydroxyglutaryl-CoA dehydratase subunit BcrC/BadD/HgdB
MELAATCYAEYGGRARELKKQGKRFIGYLCAYVPLEIIGAAGFIPFRIRGSVNEPITMADAHMETIVCPMVRSYFDNALKGAFDFIEGLVLPHSCDSMCITHDIWRTNLNLPYFHLLNIPHTAGERSHDFFLASLRTFRTSLERYAGASISDAAIREQTARYNELRAAVRRLYGLRRGPAPLITGPESVRVLVSAMSLPVEEALTMVNGVIGEASDRGPSPDTGRQRVMIVSSEQDDDTLSRIVEECGAAVVCDYTCPGMREFGTDVEAAGGPLKGLASRYLGLNCARTYFESGVGHAGDLEVRFGSIGRLAADFNVRGVVLRVHRCCDPYGLEVPSLRAYLISKGLEVLYLEDDYSMRDTGRLRTRIQAFLELVGNRPGGRKP